MGYYYMFSFLFFFLFVCMNMILYFLLMEESVILLELMLFFFQLIEMKLYFFFDGMSIMFMMIVILISFVIFLFSSIYMSGESKNYIYFLVLTFMFIFSMMMVVLSMNMWLILWGWDGLGVISYLLVIFYFSENSNYCGLVTMLINRLGDVGMILSIFFLFNINSLDMNFLSQENIMFNMFKILVIFGALTKSAQFPFSSWLPLAMAAPTPISALVHSSTLVTAGVYLLIRLNMLKSNYEMFTFNLFVLSLITMFISGLCAIYELDMKKIIALSTLSQLSLMFLIILVGSEFMSFYHILTHALFKALMFMCAGVFIYEFLDNQDVRSFSLVMVINPLVVSIFFICNFSLMGFPFLSGFYSKDMILEFMYTMNMNFYVMLMVVISIMFTSLYSLRLMYYSLVLGKMGYKFIYFQNWSLMYTSLFVLIYGVMSLGSIINWVFISKLEMMILKFSMKIINILIIFLMIFFFMMFFNKLGNSNNFLLSLFYLTDIKGGLSNMLMEKFYYFMYFSEMFIIYFMNKKILILVEKLMVMFFMLKFMIFFMAFLLFFFVYLYI